MKKTVWAWTVATFFGAGYGKPGPAHGDRWRPCCYGRPTHGSLHPTPARASAGSRHRHCGRYWSSAFPPPPSSSANPAAPIPALWSSTRSSASGSRSSAAPPTGVTASSLSCCFRLFDITKPFPVRRLERLPGGWGIVFDDVAAGLYALGVASLLRIWI